MTRLSPSRLAPLVALILLGAAGSLPAAAAKLEPFDQFAEKAAGDW